HRANPSITVCGLQAGCAGAASQARADRTRAMRVQVAATRELDVARALGGSRQRRLRDIMQMSMACLQPEFVSHTGGGAHDATWIARVGDGRQPLAGPRPSEAQGVVFDEGFRSSHARQPQSELGQPEIHDRGVQSVHGSLRRPMAGHVSERLVHYPIGFRAQYVPHFPPIDLSHAAQARALREDPCDAPACLADRSIGIYMDTDAEIQQWYLVPDGELVPDGPRPIV